MPELIRDGVARWTAIFRLLPRAGCIAGISSALATLAIGLVPVGFAIATSVLISHLDLIFGHGPAHWATVGQALVLAGITLLLQNVLTPFQFALGELVTRKVDGHCVRRLIHTSLTDASLPQLEEREVLSQLSDAQSGLAQDFGTPGGAVAGVLALVVRYSQMLAAVTLVAIIVGPGAAFTLMVAVLVVRIGYRATLTSFMGFWGRQGDQRRSMEYMFQTGIAPELSKEMRLLGILDWFRARSAEDADTHWLPIWRERIRLYFKPFIGYTLILFAGICVVLLQLRGVMSRNKLSIFELSLAIQSIGLAARFAAFFPEADISTQWGSQTVQVITRLERRFTGTASDNAVPHRTAAGLPRSSIRFDGVRFAYPGARRLVLDGLNLGFRAGQSTAIVGLNGAGKTTVVKLLSGLYEPDTGRITVDGIDLADLNPQSWHQRLAVIFQNYARYDLDARANVVLGAPRHGDDTAAFWRACDRAGATGIIARLADKERTPLSSRYSGGVDLSGGQWQRIALARALFAVEAGASVLVLDEPTAHLDVRAEVAFFNSFLDLTQGLTTIILSHRSSTVRRADRIVVLEGGRVVEDGSHDELIRATGRYAHLFRLQVSRFSAEPPQASRTRRESPP
ncbi:MAG: ABC transporter ATP-binding protein [Streptosporangiaceae bacterium]|nr:ABC transporter ATP-binding protein [Streptosporangiaceae bacterium]